MTKKFNQLDHTNIEFKIKKPTDGATIEGVHTRNLQTFVDGRGDLTEIWTLKWQDPDLVTPQHVYYNITDPNVIKGWHWHENSCSQYVCLAGKMQIVLIDVREGNKTFGEVNQFVVSSKNPMYIKIPPFVLKGWKALEENAVIINLVSSADTADNFKVPWDSFVKDVWQPING